MRLFIDPIHYLSYIVFFDLRIASVFRFARVQHKISIFQMIFHCFFFERESAKRKLRTLERGTRLEKYVITIEWSHRANLKNVPSRGSNWRRLPVSFGYILYKNTNYLHILENVTVFFFFFVHSYLYFNRDRVLMYFCVNLYEWWRFCRVVVNVFHFLFVDDDENCNLNAFEWK